METFSPLVRLFSYSDPHYSRGNRTTFRYVTMTEDCFSGKENVAYSGDKYIIWNYTQKGLDFVRGIKGYDTYSMFFEFVTQEQMDDEIITLKNKLKRLEEIVAIEV